MTDGNVERGTSHESRYGRQRNEIDNPTSTDKTDESNDATSNNSQRRSYDMRGNSWVSLCDLDDNVADDGRHDGDRLTSQYSDTEKGVSKTYPDGDVL